MAEIARFTAQAPRRGNLDVSTDTGAADMLARVSEISGQLANRLGQAADKRRIAEGKRDAAAAELKVTMPGVEYAYDGKSAATTASKVGGNVADIITAAANRYGVSPEALNRIAWIESKGNPSAKNPNSSAGGLFQFIDSTAAQYGLADRYDPAQAADAAARLTRDNAVHLRKALKREPTAGELYLAHQQGAGGASKLLSSPDRQAVDVLGWDAVRLNGGAPGMTAGQFAARWTSKLGDVAAAPVAAGRPIPPEYASRGVSQDQWDRMNAPDGADPVITGATTAPADAGAPSSTPAGGITVTLTGAAGAVPQVQGGTLYGDAYNSAALDIHLNRLDTAMRGQMDALSLQHDGDPGGLSEALDALRAGYVRDLPPEAAALVDQSFSRQKFALQREAINKFNSNLESANLAAFEENIVSRTNSAYRLASRAGLDEAADAAISGELGALTASIDASPLTPLQKSRLKADAVSGVMSARVLGGFEAQKDPAARAAYAQKFQQEWQAGAGMSAELDARTYDSINGEMVRRVQADEVAAHKRTTALETVIKSRLDYLKKGFPISGGDREFLKNEVAKTGDAELTANLDFMDGLADWQKAHVAAKPEIIDAQISAMQEKIQKEGASEAALTTLDVMEGLRDEMKKGLADDPLAWASRAGVAAVEPLDFSDGAKLAATLTERVADAGAIAKHYGIEPKYFTAAETDGLKKMLKQTPLALPSMVSSLSAGLGSATPQALAEISKDAPLLAHVAGLTNATGNQRVAVEVAEVLDRRNQPGYKSVLPTAAKLQSAASDELGAALIVLPGTLNGAMETAATLFEARALARGVDMDQFDTPGSPARTLYAEALDEVLGATTRDGIKFGGITNVNGFETVAPPDLEADSLQTMLSNISADDLIFQRSIGSANGVPIRPDDLRQGQLVMTGQGRYRIALGDVAGGDPRYVPSATGGGYFELDLGMLKRTQMNRGRDPGRPAGTGWTGRRLP